MMRKLVLEFVIVWIAFFGIQAIVKHYRGGQLITYMVSEKGTKYKITENYTKRKKNNRISEQNPPSSFAQRLLGGFFYWQRHFGTICYPVPIRCHVLNCRCSSKFILIFSRSHLDKFIRNILVTMFLSNFWT